MLACVLPACMATLKQKGVLNEARNNYANVRITRLRAITQTSEQKVYNSVLKCKQRLAIRIINRTFLIFSDIVALIISHVHCCVRPQA